MAQYKFKNNYTAKGSNVILPNEKRAMVALQKSFQGEVVDGELKTVTINAQCIKAPCPSFTSQELVVATEGAELLAIPANPIKKYAGRPSSPYSGKATFRIPLSALEEVRVAGDVSSAERVVSKDKTILYVIGGIILISGIFFMAMSVRKPKMKLK